VFDEATREHSKEPYDVLVARIRRGYPGRQRAIVLTGPPQGAGHWTAKEFGTGPGGERVGDTWQWHDTLHSTIRARTADNPYLPHDYEANLRNRPGATRAWCRQYLDAEFIAGEGQIFSEFRRDTHIVRPEAIPSQFRRVIIGVDWGYSHHGAMIVVGVTGSGTLYVIAEECHKELPVTDSGWLRIARELRDKHRPERFVADPSEPGYITTLRQTLGVTVVENADNDVHEGIRRITRSFEPVLAPGEIAPRPRMFISSRCTRLVEEIEGYRYRESRGIVTEAPQEHDDDAIDALRYAVMACTRHR
jgi:phage terminase large subunit